MELDKIRKELQKKYGEGAFRTLGETPNYDGDVISSGSINLNEALGIGGFPKGRIVEIIGAESSGKTTIATHVMAEAQKAGGEALIIDAEHAFDKEYAAKIGVDVNRLHIFQPDYGEQALNYLSDMLDLKMFSVIVIDSVAALTPKAELEGEVGDSKIGLQARMMSQAMRMLVAKIAQSGTCVVFINQLREKIGVLFGDPTTTPAGNALKFYASIRLDVTRSTTAANSTVDENGDKLSNLTKVHVKKNKCAAPFKKCEFYIKYNVGIDATREIYEVLVEKEIIKHYGKKITYGDRIWESASKEQVLEDFENSLREEVDLFEELKQKLK